MTRFLDQFYIKFMGELVFSLGLATEYKIAPIFRYEKVLLNKSLEIFYFSYPDENYLLQC